MPEQLPPQQRPAVPVTAKELRTAAAAAADKGKQIIPTAVPKKECCPGR
jgi:hypothetical protein